MNTNRLIVLFSVALALVNCGCALRSPHLDLEHAILAGDQIVAEPRSYTTFVAYHAQERTENEQWFAESFHLGERHAPQAPHPTNLPFENELEAGYSTRRMLVANGYRLWERQWDFRLLSRRDDGQWQELHRWQWPKGQRFQQIAVSNDGHYLALPDDGGCVLNTENLQRICDPNIGAMFKTLQELDPGSDATCWLTQNLNFLVVKLSERDASGRMSFRTADGKVYARGPQRVVGQAYYYAYVERSTSKVGAFPDKLFSAASSRSPSERYRGAGDDGSGHLLLLFAGANRITIRGPDLNVRYQMTIPGNDISPGEPAAKDFSWDPGTHRVLFYNHVDLGSYHKPVIMHVWDYKTGEMEDISLDISADFRVNGLRYVPAGQRE